MQNSGEVKLDLPALPSGWKWKLTISEERRYSASSHPNKFFLKSSYFTVIISDVIDDEAWYSREAEISLDWDYDQIISAVQSLVDDVHDRWFHRNIREKTSAEAITHICDVFESTGEFERR